MSHFIRMKTKFQHLFYLEKALNRLNIQYTEKKTNLKSLNSNSSPKNLLISQSNGYNIEFNWADQAYEMIVDISFWEQASPIQNFIDKISQEYTKEALIGENQKSGFKPTYGKTTENGSKVIVLDRWNTKTKQEDLLWSQY
jgi:Protein of unknown function (DUF1257)